MRNKNLVIGLMGIISVICVLFWATAEDESQPAIGKQPPEIKIAQWIGSEPLTLKQLQGKAVVLEFWATWCPPCRKSIPHLIELRKKYPEDKLVMIGITSESLSKVEPFIKQMGVNYIIALDDKGQTSTSYQIKGIPHAFVIDSKGILKWKGHPMEKGFEENIEKYVKEVGPQNKGKETSLEWLKYNEGVENLKNDKKLGVVWFYSEKDRKESLYKDFKKIFEDKRVKEECKKFILIAVDREKEVELTQKFSIEGVTVLIIDGEQKERKKISKEINPKEFLSILNEALKEAEQESGSNK